jgi:FkbM family methyltransferase
LDYFKWKVAFQRLLTAARHLQRWPEVLRCRSASTDWWKLSSNYVGLSAFTAFETSLRDGNRYRLEEYYDLETLWQIYFHRAYKLEPTDRVIVDAGANIGLFSCFAAASLPKCRIYSAEPFPSTYKRLERHVRSNGFLSRIHCFQAALAGAPGHVAMAAEGSSSQRVHVVEVDADAGGGRPTEGHASAVAEAIVEVEAVTLGDFLNGLDEQQVDLLKMDIEGSEYEVLLAASTRDLDRVKRINLEYHAKPGFTKRDILEHLVRCGFHIVSHQGAGDYGMVHLTRG